MGKGRGDNSRPALGFKEPKHDQLFNELERLEASSIRIWASRSKWSSSNQIHILSTQIQELPVWLEEEHFKRHYKELAAIDQGAELELDSFLYILKSLPDGAGDEGVRLALIGYVAGYDYGREAGYNQARVDASEWY